MLGAVGLFVDRQEGGCIGEAGPEVAVYSEVAQGCPPGIGERHGAVTAGHVVTWSHDDDRLRHAVGGQRGEAVRRRRTGEHVAGMGTDDSVDQCRAVRSLHGHRAGAERVLEAFAKRCLERLLRPLVEATRYRWLAHARHITSPSAAGAPANVDLGGGCVLSYRRRAGWECKTLRRRQTRPCGLPCSPNATDLL